jgi:putative Holliday junction resolvase
MRTLAIDLGSKRVGLALSDEGGNLATPLAVLQVTSPRQAADEVLKVAAKEGVQRLVVGLPLNMDDSIGPQARNTANWAADLGRRSGLPVVLVDERLSSFEAEQSLAARRRGGEKLTRGMKKERLDAIAATGFLQAYLDGNLGAIDVGTG